ncbi:3-isopropylmalate dehydratase small subunit [Pseudocitrobacter cyperus]|uniref:3-isopropylmalate dehydratase small subunit n=1 Tax=Pseudocitrobacter cyperus TaxID=3112843 RepID=A0ABV0HIX9_9ENTR
MEPIKIVTGIMAPMMDDNIDTDVIMPKQFLKGIDREGLDKGLFFDLRFNKSGECNQDFVLNKAMYRGAKVLIVGDNFGCGSSREHAVWGLKQLGIRILIGTSFAGIFNDNCARNGILTITLDHDLVLFIAEQAKKGVSITVDLSEQLIAVAEKKILFDIDSVKKYMLLNGLDAIDLTLQYVKEIKSFEKLYFEKNHWLKI